MMIWDPGSKASLCLFYSEDGTHLVHHLLDMDVKGQVFYVYYWFIFIV